MIVSEENPDSVLVWTEIKPDSTFQGQEESLIVWADTENMLDLAISFQEPRGRDLVFEHICNAQEALAKEDALRARGLLESGGEGISSSSSGFHHDTEEDDDGGVRTQRSPGRGGRTLTPLGHGSGLDSFSVMSAMGPYGGLAEEAAMYSEVPLVGEDTLVALAKVLTNVVGEQKNAIASILMSQSYIPDLLDLFDQLEVEEKEGKLYEMYEVMKALILMNEQALIEILLSKEYIIRLIGVLEYDPELPSRPNHREFLTAKAKFKQVLPFSSPELESIIHQTFQVSYIKDVVMPRVLDDATFTTLNTLIYFNNIEIISQISADDAYLPAIFAEIVGHATGATTDPDRIKDCVLFLDEFFNLTKALQLKRRTEMFRDLCTKGLLDVFVVTIDWEDKAVRMATTDIFACVVTHDPALMVEYLMSEQAAEYPLFQKIMFRLTSDPEDGVQTQLTESLRVLLDMESLKESPRQEDFLDLFYAKMIQILVEPFRARDPGGDDGERPELRGFIKNNISDLLSFCIQQHGFRCKYFILSNNVAANVLQLALSPEMYLALAAVRFMRAFLAVGDVRYWKYVIHNKLFDPIVARFMHNGARDNLYTAAVAELLNFVGKTGVKSIVSHVMETYMPVLETSPFAFVFGGLREAAAALEETPELAVPGSPITPFSRVYHNPSGLSRAAASNAAAATVSAAAAAAASAPPSTDPLPPLLGQDVEDEEPSNLQTPSEFVSQLESSLSSSSPSSHSLFTSSPSSTTERSSVLNDDDDSASSASSTASSRKSSRDDHDLSLDRDTDSPGDRKRHKNLSA